MLHTVADTMDYAPSPHSYSSADSQESSNLSSPISVVLSPSVLESLINTSGGNMNGPYLKIIEQPVEKFRFRYKSEMMGTHGSILGKSSDRARKKTYPTVELVNYGGPAIIRCSLYTANSDCDQRTLHTHRLVVRHGNEDKDDPHEILVSRENGYVAVFQGMGIIHTAKKHITEELIKKKRARRLEILQAKNINSGLTTKDEVEIKVEAESEAKRMNLNSVSLCFEAFYRDSNDVLIPIAKPIFSHPINNMKSALTGELKICRIDKHASSCAGGEEVFILVEKVGKKNIKIKFFELDDEENEIWSDNGRFSELDVHHQYAIVFRTPPYRFTDIEEKVEVYLQLYRPTDGDCSEPIKFTYKPTEKIGRKRPRSSLTDDFSVLNRSNFPQGNELNTNHPSLTDPHLFEVLINEKNEDHVMNSAEFKDFLNNLSITVDYQSTLPSNGFNDNLSFAVDHMDADAFLVTDGEKRKSSAKEKGKELVDGHVAQKFEKLTTSDICVKKEPQDKGDESFKPGTEIVKNVISQLQKLMNDKPPPKIIHEKILEIFSPKTIEGYSPLHLAIIHDKASALQTMLTILRRGEHDSIINMKCNRLQTPLHLAVLYKLPNYVKMLLEVGADPNAANDVGNTALHLAVQHLSDDCLHQLLNKSNYVLSMNTPNCNALNDEGCTPLHSAAFRNNLTALKMLIEAGGLVNLQKKTCGRTVLHISVEERNKEMLLYLVSKTNIEIDKETFAGCTALSYALLEGTGDQEIARILKEHNADPDKAKPKRRGSHEFPCKAIKEEPDSDDEYQLHIVESERDDCRTDNSGILEMLKKVQESPGQPKSPDFDCIKEEEMCDSPLSECSLTEENGLFDDESLNKLCEILDKSRGWVNLADLMDYSFLVPSIRNATSPSKLLFNYADLHGNVSVQDIRDFLEALDEHAAVEAIDLMLARQLADCH